MLNIEPAQKAIREVFLRRIVKAKGLSKADSAPLRHPHAHALGGDAGHGAAVLRLPGAKAGIGDLLAVDVGGATTDVYSVSEGAPTARSTPSARVFRSPM